MLAGNFDNNCWVQQFLFHVCVRVRDVAEAAGIRHLRLYKETAQFVWWTYCDTQYYWVESKLDHFWPSRLAHISFDASFKTFPLLAKSEAANNCNDKNPRQRGCFLPAFGTVPFYIQVFRLGIIYFVIIKLILSNQNPKVFLAWASSAANFTQLTRMDIKNPIELILIHWVIHLSQFSK